MGVLFMMLCPDRLGLVTNYASTTGADENNKTSDDKQNNAQNTKHEPPGPISLPFSLHLVVPLGRLPPLEHRDFAKTGWTTIHRAIIVPSAPRRHGVRPMMKSRRRANWGPTSGFVKISARLSFVPTFSSFAAPAA